MDLNKVVNHMPKETANLNAPQIEDNNDYKENDDEDEK